MTTQTQTASTTHRRWQTPFFYVLPYGEKYAICKDKPFALLLSKESSFPKMINWDAFEEEDNDWDWYLEDLKYFNLQGKFVEG